MPKLELTDAEIRVIGGALGELPFKTVANLVYKIDAQLEDQRKQAETPADAAVDAQADKEKEVHQSPGDS